MNTQDAKRVLETALICAQQPMSLRDMRTLFDDVLGADTVRILLDELVVDWQGRGVELVALSSGWRFQSRPEMREFLDRLHPEKPPRYSRAVMETLAIIAYRQPVTRGDIEDIRGVVVSTPVIKQLEDRGWIETIGHREAPGRPALFATTRQFLDDLGLGSLEELPMLDGVAPAVQALAELSPQASLITVDGDEPAADPDQAPPRPGADLPAADAMAAAPGLAEVQVEVQAETEAEPPVDLRAVPAGDADTLATFDEVSDATSAISAEDPATAAEPDPPEPDTSRPDTPDNEAIARAESPTGDASGTRPTDTPTPTAPDEPPLESKS